MRRIYCISAAIVLLFFLGCAPAINESAAGGDSEGNFSTTDSRGFEKNLGPAEIAYQSAQQFLSAGNYDEAITHLQKAVSIKPTYLEAWSQLGSALTAKQNYEAGIEAYSKALELSPGNEGLISSIGYNYMVLENWDKAQEYYLMITQKDSLNYNGNVNLAFIAKERGDIDDAIKYYELALSANENDATTMGTLANLYGKKDDKAKKYEYLERAIAAAPDNHRFKTQLARSYFNDKDYAKAIPLYEELTAIFPDDASNHQRLGFALSQTDRKAEAPAELEKAIELGSKDAFTYAILSKIYNENKMSTKAIQAAQDGLTLGQGEDAFLYYQWGVALSDLGSYEEAIGKFERVVSFNDPLWSPSAEKQINRQNLLIKRRKAEKEKEMYE